MDIKKTFEFLNNPVWIEYTQKKYLPVNDIQYRLNKLGISQRMWPELRKKIQDYRKRQAVPIFLSCLNKKFWFFESDLIKKKIYNIRSMGDNLWFQIQNYAQIKTEFLKDMYVEEALASAIYEGANSTRAQAKFLLLSEQEPKNKDEYMLLNNLSAMNWIKNHHKYPLSKNTVLKIHKIITNNTLEEGAGKFRNDKVYIGAHEGIPFEKIDRSVEEVIALLNKPTRYLYDGLLAGILLHYFIAYIHPFFDGNGRTARTLFYFYSIKNRLDFMNLISISSDLKRSGKQYEKSFNLVKEYDLDITYFIIFFLNSLDKGLKLVQNKVDYLIKIALRKKDLAITTDQVLLLQKLAINKFLKLTIEEYSKEVKKSREFARKNLLYLLSKGFLNMETIQNKFFFRINKEGLKNKIDQLM